MSTQQHYTRVLDRFGDQATALDGEAVKAEAQARQLSKLITTGQQQRAQVATDVTELERQKAELERQIQEQQVRLAALDEDLAAKQGALEDAQGDAGDYRAEAEAIRAIVRREVAVLEQSGDAAAGQAPPSPSSFAPSPGRHGSQGPAS